MLELVLTNSDLAGLTVVDNETLVDSGSNPKKAYTLKNPDVLDASGARRILAVLGVLDNYDDDTEISYISYVEDGTLYPVVTTPGDTVTVIREHLNGVIRMSTELLNAVDIRITREDCERVKLHSGKPMWEKTGTAKDIQGFTLTTKNGNKFSVSVPEYLRMPLFQTHLDIVGLAATALTLEALAALPANTIIDRVYFDLPDTELNRATPISGWFYIGVYHPVRASELMRFLDMYLQMFIPQGDKKHDEIVNNLLKDRK